jgi:superfamily I DNA and/or RNA helicase
VFWSRLNLGNFIGSEAAFVICLFSVPQSHTTDLGFLLERRRLNVAISRAQSLCILVTSDEVLRPSVRILANEDTAKGYAFLKAFEERAWSYDLAVDLNNTIRD